MSHWTRVKTRFREKRFLSEAAEACGCGFLDGKAVIEGHQGAMDVDAKIFVKGRDLPYERAGFVEGDQGFTLVGDFWSNPITDKIGRTGEKLTSAYAEAVVMDEAANMGASVLGRSVTENGEVHIRLGLS